jgi:hypothetical protein
MDSVSFSEIGIKERADLEQWIINHPEMLGEKLLIMTSEFDGFDKSNSRLDILAIDASGGLVVIEIKLDANRSLADLQAIRYAAFCSAMTIDNLIGIYAKFEGLSGEAASQRICDFLDVNEAPELNNRPRIILAAGSIEDQELTSSVLWLRSFGMDISCVELTPYRLSNAEIILVPRTIIPIPEAKEYLVNIQQKEVSQIIQTREQSEYSKLLMAIAQEFNNLGAQFTANNKPIVRYLYLDTSTSRVHYAWQIRKREAALEVGVYFESLDLKRNLELLDLMLSNETSIRKDTNLEFKIERFGKISAKAAFRLPLLSDIPSGDNVKRAADTMKMLIDRTWPLLGPLVKEQ